MSDLKIEFSHLKASTIWPQSSVGCVRMGTLLAKHYLLLLLSFLILLLLWAPCWQNIMAYHHWYYLAPCRNTQLAQYLPHQDIFESARYDISLKLWCHLETGSLQ